MGTLRMFDCYQDVPLTFQMFGSMFRNFDLTALTAEEFSYLGLSLSQYVIVFLGTMLMFGVSMIQRKGSVREWISTKPYIVKYAIFVSLFLSVLLFGAYGVGFDATQFIYNQF